MTISKDRQRRKRPSNRHDRYNTPENFARRAAGNDARRMAAEPPMYPPMRKGGDDAGDHLLGRIWGQPVNLQLRAPFATGNRRPRSETMSVWIDGKCVARAVGLTGLFALVAGGLAKPMSRKTMAGTLEQYTARDEMDAAAPAMACWAP